MSFFFDVISGKKKGLLFDILRAILWIFSCFYLVAITIRKLLYKFKIFKSYHPGIPTISIGNITAGGTGKTPLTIFLTERLAKTRPTGVLLRGYKSRGEQKSCLGEITKIDPLEYGDEACLIKKRIPDAHIYVGKNRSLSAKRALQDGVECLVLDDGLQHFALERSFNIIVIDAENPFGYGYFLPRGLLREPKSSLSRANLIILNHVEKAKDKEALQQEIRKHSSSPIVTTSLVFDGFFDLSGKKCERSTGKVGIFCGIGKPSSFYESVASFGFTIVDHLFVADHEEIDNETLVAFWERVHSLGATSLLCTEKDAIKLSSSFSFPIYSVRIRLHVVEGQSFIDNLIANTETL